MQGFPIVSHTLAWVRRMMMSGISSSVSSQSVTLWRCLNLAVQLVGSLHHYQDSITAGIVMYCVMYVMWLIYSAACTMVHQTNVEPTHHIVLQAKPTPHTWIDWVIFFLSAVANQDPIAVIMGPAFASVGGVPGGNNTLLEVHKQLAREKALGGAGDTTDELDSSFRLMLLINNLDLKLLHTSVKQMGKYVYVVASLLCKLQVSKSSLSRIL